ncbi:MAG: hypothetical protein AAB209_10640, partial [Bacteroidota bacterium]
MKKKVYIETTIPSFYYEERTQAIFVAQRELTRQWWETKRQQFELVTGAAVFKELEDGDYPHKQKKIELLSGIKILPVTDSAIEIVETYIQHKVM